MKHVALVIAIILSLAIPCSVTARFIQSWSYQKLFAKSDFVVVARPRVATRDTSERSTLRDVIPPEPVIVVITEFQTLLVLKGPKKQRFILQHCRLPESDVAWISGPSLMSFNPEQNHRPYLLFLARQPNGRFAPVAGQMDLDISVQELSGSAE